MIATIEPRFQTTLELGSGLSLCGLFYNEQLILLLFIVQMT